MRNIIEDKSDLTATLSRHQRDEPDPNDCVPPPLSCPEVLMFLRSDSLGAGMVADCERVAFLGWGRLC